MPFKAGDENELQNLAPGDEVTFSLYVSEQDNWIGGVRKTGRTGLLDSSASAPSPAQNVKPLKVGDPVPDHAFTDERGEPFRLREFKGKVLALTFIFTRCPVPNFCRRMSANFADASEQLKARKTPRNWHLLSITFDPEFDTPATLKQYAERYNHDPAYWSFATGERKEIEDLARQFGLVVRGDSVNFDHNLRTAVIDPDGRVRKIFSGNEWTPEELVREIVVTARPAKRG
jgi:protein SCO1/2